MLRCDCFQGAQPVVALPKEDNLLQPNKSQSDNDNAAAATETTATCTVGDGTCRLEPSAGDGLQSKQSLPIPQIDGSGRVTVASSPESIVEDPSR